MGVQTGVLGFAPVSSAAAPAGCAGAQSFRGQGLRVCKLRRQAHQLGAMRTATCRRKHGGDAASRLRAEMKSPRFSELPAEAPNNAPNDLASGGVAGEGQMGEWQKALLTSSIIWQALMVAVEIYFLFPGAAPLLRATMLLRHCSRVVLLAALNAVRSAIMHSRLNSVTYRRLSLGVVLSSQLMTIAYSRNQSILPTLVARGGLATYYIQYVGVLMTWWAGVGGGMTAFSKLPSFPLRVLKSVGDFVFVPPRVLFSPAGIYAAVLLASVGTLSWIRFGAIPSAVLAASASNAALGSYLWRSLGREEIGVMLASLFVLWDASQRGRLGASTFQHLNLAFALSCALRAGIVLAFSSALAPLGIPPFALSAIFAGCSLFFAYMYTSSRKSKP